MTEPLAEIRGFSVAYGPAGKKAYALRDVDLDITQGQRLAIIGESGSGKTTLALSLAGLLPPEAIVTGSIRWSGLGQTTVAGRDIGFVFQDPGSSLNPVLRIGEQVAEGARRHLGLGRRAALEHALELLKRVQIPHPEAALNAYPHQFSGGQRQRIAIAAAIAARPKVLIADEPTSALDMIVQAEIVRLLDRLVREEGMTLVFVTHDIALASNLADGIAVFRDGSLVEAGRTRDVLSNPSQRYTRTLIATHIDFASPRLIETA